MYMLRYRVEATGWEFYFTGMRTGWSRNKDLAVLYLTYEEAETEFLLLTNTDLERNNIEILVVDYETDVSDD
jgi:hypothetical protein